MKKKNGFVKPTNFETDIQKTFSAIVSSTPQNPQTVNAITKRIRNMGKQIEKNRKKGERRLIGK